MLLLDTCPLPHLHSCALFAGKHCKTDLYCICSHIFEQVQIFSFKTASLIFLIFHAPNQYCITRPSLKSPDWLLDLFPHLRFKLVYTFAVSARWMNVLPMTCFCTDHQASGHHFEFAAIILYRELYRFDQIDPSGRIIHKMLFCNP